MNRILSIVLLALTSCASDGRGLGLVAKGHVDGDGVVATDGKRTLIFARGTAEAGIYQIDSTGQLRLTRPLAAATDSVRVIDHSVDPALDVTVGLGAPLPTWSEPIVRSLLTSDEIAGLGLTWELGS